MCNVLCLTFFKRHPETVLYKDGNYKPVNKMERTLGTSGYISLSLFVVTIFLSAFLLFQVQPLIAKHILPWFGGSPSVWTVCMLFFQMLLIGGYAYAHLLDGYLTPRKQAVTHIMLLCAALIWLPIIPDATWKPQNDEMPVLHILLLLLASVGLPYFALSTTGSLFQTWFRRLHKGRSPYPLYAVSNTGSLLALLSYPLLVEVWWSTDDLGVIWSGGFALFVLLSSVVAFRLATTTGDILTAATSMITSSVPERVDGEVRFLWLSLPAMASILLLAITNHLTQNVAVVPFLWIVPLSLYLLSFILCFESDRWYRRTGWWLAFFLALIAVSYSMYPGVAMSLLAKLTLYNTFFFITCMVCHGELVKLRPHGRALTAFYLYIAFGGALGGLFVAVIAPLLFSDYLELHVSLALVYLLAPLAVFRDKSSRCYAGKSRWLWGLYFIGGVLLGVLLYINNVYTNTRFTETSRNFYGVLHIADDNTGKIRQIFHGNIVHGMQYLDQKRRHQPTSYYTANSGVGQVMELTAAADKQRRIGIIGLGAGTLASYGQAGDILRFYEINPEVVRLATERFFYLSDTPALVETVVGDARLMLEAEADKDFDVFVIDAFSGDAIPVHLLTYEAFTIYNRHLKDDGVICVHISNRYLDLRPAIEAMATAFGLSSSTISSKGSISNGSSAADWMILTRNTALLTKLDGIAAQKAGAPVLSKPWTDSHSNIFTLLKH